MSFHPKEETFSKSLKDLKLRKKKKTESQKHNSLVKTLRRSKGTRFNSVKKGASTKEDSYFLLS